jgi:membrane associated rhomboid family serine protease
MDGHPDTLDLVETEAETRYCYRHPDRETGLSCSECGRPICYECMTPAPVGLRCPEHSGKPQGVRKVSAAAERVATRGGRRPYPVTVTLVAINVGIFLLELALGGTRDGTHNSIYNQGALVANGVIQNGNLYGLPSSITAPGLSGVAHGEWWRLLTSAFLHYGITHLALNMLALFWLGRILEEVIGSLRYLLLYVASGLAGSAGALLLTPNSPSAGASGAIFGVLGALLVLERRGVIASGGQILVLLLLNLAITFWLPGISRGAHLGGLIGGIVVMLLYLRFPRSRELSVASAVGVAVASVVLAYAVV